MSALAIDVRDYGAVSDAIKLTDGSCSGTSFSSPSANFGAGDIGKTVKITNGYASDGIFLGTIFAVPNSTTITLSGSVVSPVTGTAQMVYGIDNAANLNAAFTAAQALIKTSDVKIIVYGPSNSDGGGYLFASPLSSDNLNLNFEAPLYSAVGLGTNDNTIPWDLGNSDITNIRMDVSGGRGPRWGNTGGHSLYLNKFEVSNVGFNG